VTGARTRSVKTAAAHGADGESEQRVVLSQELGSTGVESDGGSDKTESSTSLVDGSVLSELANHEEEEGQVKKGEEGNQGDVNPQGCQQEDESDDEPRSQEDTDSVGELFGGLGVGSCNTVVGVKEGREGQPETSVRSKSGRAESVASREFPHSSSELSKATDETSHADDGIGDRDTTSADVVHGQDESGAGEGEEAKRTRVTDDPQLGGGVVNIGVGGKSRSGISSTAVVMFVTNIVGVVDGAFLVGDVAHCGRRV